MSYENLLEQLVADDDKHIVLTAENRAAIRNLPDKIGGNFIDTGITEQTMIGMSAGLALRGRKPIVHALSTFLTMRAFEFIRTDVGLPNLPVKMVGAFAGFLSEANGPTHQAVEDVSLMRGIPHVNVFCPADEDDMLKCLPQIIEHSSPFYIRYNNIPNLYKHGKYEYGKAEVVSQGFDVVMLVYGTVFNQAFLAMELLASRGISVKLINLRTVKPIDTETVISSIKNCELAVTIEDHFLTGGLYSVLCEIMVKNSISANVLPLALYDRWFRPALLDEVMFSEGFSGPQLAEKIEDSLFNNKKNKYYAEWSNF